MSWFHGARRIRVLASAVSLRGDYTSSELRGLAAATKIANQSRRLLSLAAVLDGMNRTAAARIGGMDRQTLRDWVHRFNAHGPEGAGLLAPDHPPASPGAGCAHDRCVQKNFRPR
ncbi:MAG: helix-turn-helix domain-containing protein [Mesorhizobium sp.]|nr:MAG: helix-turn-helix domain-containing protein [Mesorhizobium sp.]